MTQGWKGWVMMVQHMHFIMPHSSSERHLIIPNHRYSLGFHMYILVSSFILYVYLKLCLRQQKFWLLLFCNIIQYFIQRLRFGPGHTCKECQWDWAVWLMMSCVFIDTYRVLHIKYSGFQAALELLPDYGPIFDIYWAWYLIFTDEMKWNTLHCFPKLDGFQLSKQNALNG